jgi:hypothetical protein
MIEFPKVISKSAWFVLFNVVSITYLIATKSLRWEVVSVVSCLLTLLLFNGIALISARKYKDWKWK